MKEGERERNRASVWEMEGFLKSERLSDGGVTFREGVWMPQRERERDFNVSKDSLSQSLTYYIQSSLSPRL